MPEPDPTPPRAPDTPDTPGLEAEVRALREELSFLRRHRMFVIYQSVPRILFFRFAVGMAVGLGTVIGATVLLSVIIWALSQIEFLPIIGEWSAQIAQQIDAAVNGAD
ncbi:hypothetical protein A8B78_20300 [Jannaschia sp. EhC01]|nr:hypothetical protein A8B78_20300 [Jannaschia sp. EhC01]